MMSPVSPLTMKKEASPFEAVLNGLPDRLSQQWPQQPDWLKRFQESERKRFQALKFPNHKQEAWKYIDLRAVLSTPYAAFPEETQKNIIDALTKDLSSLRLADNEQSSPVPPWGKLGGDTFTMVFLNGRYCSQFSCLEELPESAIITDFQSAAIHHADLFQRCFLEGAAGKVPEQEPGLPESEPFAALNGALFENGAFIFLPEGFYLEKPIHLLFLTTPEVKPVTIAPRVCLVVEKHAKAQVFIKSMALTGNMPDQAYLIAPVIQANLHEAAELDYLWLQQESDNGIHLGTTELALAGEARCRMTSISLGGHTVRHNIAVALLAAQAECTLNGLTILNGANRVFNRTVMDHQAPACISRQLYKSIVDGQAQSEFDGMIIVRKPAQQTDAVQMNKNLTLSDDARVFARPQLRIDADDVKCSHGATVGQLAEEELFYLAARGLNPELARQILTYGFAEEIVEKLDLKNYLNRFILEKLSMTGPIPEMKRK